MIMIIAADLEPASELLGYIKAFFCEVPMLRELLENETAEAVELTSRVRIQVNSASYTRTRGFAIAVAILDELAFWPTDMGSANPDREILNAIRPGQAQFGEHAMLLCASSPSQSAVAFTKRISGVSGMTVIRCWYGAPRPGT